MKLPVRVSVTLADPQHVRFRATSLDDVTFRLFQQAIEGARYVRSIGARVATMDKVQEILVHLRDATVQGRPCFEVVLDDPVTQALRTRSAHQWLDIQGVQDRIANIDRELRETKGASLFPYQRTGAQWLALRHAGLLADDMGLGKTLQTIVALPAKAPVLVVCPVKVKGTWLGEMSKWRPHLQVTVLKGRSSFRWPQPGEVVVTNYDILPDIHDRKGTKGRRCDGYLPAGPCTGCAERSVVQRSNVITVRDAHGPDCTGKSKHRQPCPGCHPILTEAAEGTVVVFDEAHKLKNEKAGRTRSAKALGDGARAKKGRVWPLTGTPLENDPQELWNVLDVAGLAETAFDNRPTFLKLFHAKRKSPRFGGYVFGTPDDEVKDRLRRVSLRRMKREVLPELPTKMWKQHVVDIDRATLQACEGFVKKHGGIERIVELLQKDKFPFEIMSAVRAALATAKIPAMLSYVEMLEEENAGPIVVFSAHRAPIEALQDRPGWAIIMGGVGESVSNAAVNAFQSGQLRGLGITIGAGSEGLTLTKSNQAVFVDRAWKPTANAQAEDRLVRIGTTRGVIITLLEADHALDRRVSEVLTQKQRLIEATVDASSVGAAMTLDPVLRNLWEAARRELESGEANREPSRSDAERETIEQLHQLTFEAGADEAMALALAEEADAIGLTPGQWALASALAARGHDSCLTRAENTSIRLAETFDENPEPSTPIETTPMRLSDKKSSEPRTTTNEEAPRRALRPTVAGRRRRRDREAERREKLRSEGEDILEDFAELLEDAEPDDRMYLLGVRDQLDEEMAEIMCLECGEDPHEEGEPCPAHAQGPVAPGEGGEDEDEDEEEDEEDEGGDET